MHYIGDLCNLFRAPAKTDKIDFEIVEDKMLLFFESSRLVGGEMFDYFSARERERVGSVLVYTSLIIRLSLV